MSKCDGITMLRDFFIAKGSSPEQSACYKQKRSKKSKERNWPFSTASWNLKEKMKEIPTNPSIEQQWVHSYHISLLSLLYSSGLAILQLEDCSIGRPARGSNCCLNRWLSAFEPRSALARNWRQLIQLQHVWTWGLTSFYTWLHQTVTSHAPKEALPSCTSISPSVSTTKT